MFKVVVADPPWPFGDKLPGKKRGAEKHYSVLSIEQLCALELPQIDENALLFLWRVSSQIEEACRVARAWGFVPKSEIVWVKTTKENKIHFGMGRYVRASHETCLIASRGHGNRLIRDRGVRSIFVTEEDALFDARAGEHSEKPELFYEIVEKLVDGPYVELFARRLRPGWTCLGNEVKDAPTTLLSAGWDEV